MKKILIASKNQNKINEIEKILNEFDIQSLTHKEIKFDDIEETGKTFEENAVLKAKNAYLTTNIPSISDDSGIIIDAIPEMYGVYTKRTVKNNTKKFSVADSILENMKGIKNRKAKTVCAIAFVISKIKIYTFKGILEGEITTNKQGSEGFGFDPVFIPKGYNRTLSQLGIDIKNQISHRKIALDKFKSYLENENNIKL